MINKDVNKMSKTVNEATEKLIEVIKSKDNNNKELLSVMVELIQLTANELIKTNNVVRELKKELKEKDDIIYSITQTTGKLINKVSHIEQYMCENGI